MRIVQAAGSLGLTRAAGAGAGGNPFFRLLRQYLQHFLPRPVPGAPTLQQPCGVLRSLCQLSQPCVRCLQRCDVNAFPCSPITSVLGQSELSPADEPTTAHRTSDRLIDTLM